MAQDIAIHGGPSRIRRYILFTIFAPDSQFNSDLGIERAVIRNADVLMGAVLFYGNVFFPDIRVVHTYHHMVSSFRD